MAEVLLVISIVCTLPAFIATAALGAYSCHLTNEIVRENVRENDEITAEIEKLIQEEENIKQLKEAKRQIQQRKMVQQLNYILGLDAFGKPYNETGIIHLLNKNPNFDVSYIYDNGETLLDIAIMLSSIKAFDKILSMPNIPLETLLHSINYLNQMIVRLPKNKSRPQMKIILENKLRELEFDI